MLIPGSIVRDLEGQDLSVLYEVQRLVEMLISEREQPVEPKLQGNREVLKVRHFGSMTYRLERVSCGKKCKGCPHGPYWYGYWREGGRTRSKYIGKSLSRAEKIG